MQHKLIKFIAANQFIGGALGLPTLFYLAWHFITVNPALWEIKEARVYFIFFYSCLGIFFIIAMVAGILLYKAKQQGLWLSYFVQLVQVPSFILPHLSYFMGVGLNFFCNVAIKTNHLGLQFSTNFPLNFNVATVANQVGNYTFGLNLVAVYFCYILFKKHKDYIPYLKP